MLIFKVPFTYIFGGANGNEGLGVFSLCFDFQYIGSAALYLPLKVCLNILLDLYMATDMSIDVRKHPHWVRSQHSCLLRHLLWKHLARERLSISLSAFVFAIFECYQLRHLQPDSHTRRKWASRHCQTRN